MKILFFVLLTATASADSLSIGDSATYEYVYENAPTEIATLTIADKDDRTITFNEVGPSGQVNPMVIERSLYEKMFDYPAHHCVSAGGRIESMSTNFGLMNVCHLVNKAPREEEYSDLYVSPDVALEVVKIVFPSPVGQTHTLKSFIKH